MPIIAQSKRFVIKPNFHKYAEIKKIFVDIKGCAGFKNGICVEKMCIYKLQKSRYNQNQSKPQQRKRQMQAVCATKQERVERSWSHRKNKHLHQQRCFSKKPLNNAL